MIYDDYVCHTLWQFGKYFFQKLNKLIMGLYFDLKCFLVLLNCQMFLARRGEFGEFGEYGKCEYFNMKRCY